MLEKIDKLFYRVCAAIGTLSYVGVVVLMVLNVADVLMDTLLGAPIVGSYELTERILMCTVFASLAYGQACKAHVNMTLLVCHFPRVLKFGVFGLMSAGATAASAAWTYAEFLQIFETIRTNTITPVLKLPVYPFHAFAFFTLVFLTLILLWDTVMIFLAIRSDWCAKQVTKTWA